MADLSNEGLDPNVEENSGGLTVVPEGKYPVVIVGDKLTPTKSGTGKMLELKVQIIDGEHRGDTITDRLNIVNTSSVAQAIGQGQLKRICNLCSVQYPPTSTDGLIGKPMIATVKVEQFTSNRTGELLNSNKISGYNPVLATPPTQKATATQW